MPQMELAGIMLEVDEHGFIQETNKWNEDIAKAYAKKENMNELTKDHWNLDSGKENYPIVVKYQKIQANLQEMIIYKI
jgi:sulfur relay (sulfurtransferase) DsrC/TusE family protein